MNLFIWLATGLYCIQGALWFRSNPAQSAVMAGYIIANLGLIWSVK